MSIQTTFTRSLMWALWLAGCTGDVASSVGVSGQELQGAAGHSSTEESAGATTRGDKAGRRGDRGGDDQTVQVCKVSRKFDGSSIATSKTVKSDYASQFVRSGGAICNAEATDCCLSANHRRAYCTSLSTDAANCGACGQSCASGQRCNAGVCVASTRDGSSGRLQRLEDEICYEFKTHASTTSVDDAPFQVATGTNYEQFYFRAPWPTGSVATGFATLADNTKVLHHWFLFSTSEDQANGYHQTAPLPTLIGTDPKMLAAWGAGGTNVVPPDDVGFELPAQGSQLNLQWAYSNSTGQTQPDASSVQICVTPGSKRAHVANVTWLGTEDLGGNAWFGGEGMPPHQMSTFSSMCTPGRAGLGASDAIHIVGFQSHMHQLGTRMATDVAHTNGTVETLFDQPFKFGDEKHYFKSYDVQPGETLITHCTFNNTTDVGVPYGTDANNEACYQFVFAYPGGALTNGAASLLGQSDTCW